MALKKSSLVSRILIFIISTSIFFSIIATIIQLRGEFRNSHQILLNNQNYIEKSYVASVANSLYNFNDEKLTMELDGILKLNHITFIGISELTSNGKFYRSVGSLETPYDFEKTFDLYPPLGFELNEKFGELIIRFSYKDLHHKIYQNFYIILLTNIIKIFAISLLIFFFVRKNITDHLIKISAYASSLNYQEDSPPLRIRQSASHSHNELDELCDSLNNLRLRIQQDIYNLKKSQDEVLQMQKLESLGTMMRGITHDFNNLMRSITGYIELAQATCSSDSSTYAHLEKATLSALKASDLIKQILSFCRQDKPNLEKINISLTIEETIPLIQSFAPKEVNINYNLEKNLFIYADRSQLIQVLLNLVTNSFHAMKDSPGTLLIDLSKKVSEKHGPICLSVSDTGHGIPIEIRKKIFDPFFTTKTGEEGTGLGLSVVHGIISKLGGNMEVYSVVNHGTKFSIFLPEVSDNISQEQLHQAPKQSSQEEIIETTCHRLSTILLVDDESDLVALTTKTLHRLGYEVLIALDSKTALKIFIEKKSSIDLIITDLTMPVMSGIDLATEIRKIDQTIPIILSTGQITTGFDNLIKKGLITDILHKPYRRSDLALLLNKFISKQSSPINI